MKLDIEWRVPWPTEWDPDKKVAAADRLVEYMTKGTFYSPDRRIKASNVRHIGPPHDPVICLTLEN